MKYYQTFRVFGSGYFPYDMLRYDHCWPADQDSAVTMGESDEKRSLKMARHVHIKDEHPTIGRWQSFGWTVEPNSIVSLKF